VNDETVMVPVPQLLAEDLLAVVRAARDLPGVAAHMSQRLGCESGFVADLATHLEKVLAPFPLVSVLPDRIRFFVPRGGRMPEDVVFMLKQTRPGRINYQAQDDNAVRSMPERTFFEAYEEITRADFVSANSRRGG
jgi:hypothetical protein